MGRRLFVHGTTSSITELNLNNQWFDAVGRVAGRKYRRNDKSQCLLMPSVQAAF